MLRHTLAWADEGSYDWIRLFGNILLEACLGWVWYDVYGGKDGEIWRN